MSFAPPTILAVRKLIQVHVPQLSAVELGIVGSDSHANSGTSYHLGKDAVRADAYSVDESSRDRNGLSNAASGLDIGYFKVVVKGVAHTLRGFNAWAVVECRAGAPDTRDIREIIYSLDGEVVKRWDDLGIRSSGDSSHRTHTHISWYRDSETRDKTSLFRRWFEHIGAIETPEKDMPLTSAEIQDIADAVWAKKLQDPYAPTDPARLLPAGTYLKYSDSRGQATRIEGAIADVNARAVALEATLAQFGAVLAEIAARPAGGAPTVSELIEALRAVLREGTGE